MPPRYPAQPKRLTALKLPVPPRQKLPADLKKYFGICDEKIGFVPNVLQTYSFDEGTLQIRKPLRLRVIHHKLRQRIGIK